MTVDLGKYLNTRRAKYATRMLAAHLSLASVRAHNTHTLALAKKGYAYCCTITQTLRVHARTLYGLIESKQRRGEDGEESFLVPGIIMLRAKKDSRDGWPQMVLGYNCFARVLTQ